MDWLLSLFLSLLRFEDRARKVRIRMSGRTERQEEAGARKGVNSFTAIRERSFRSLLSDLRKSLQKHFQWWMVPSSSLPVQPTPKLDSYTGSLQASYNTVAVLFLKLGSEQKHWSTNILHLSGMAVWGQKEYVMVQSLWGQKWAKGRPSVPKVGQMGQGG